MSPRRERYRARAEACDGTDYGSPASVRRHNIAVEEMRRLVAEPGAAVELLPLLADPSTAKWLAFHLLEVGGLGDDATRGCLAVVEAVAAGGDVVAIGAQAWLREHGYAETGGGPDRRGTTAFPDSNDLQ